jgi:OmpA-OmpF porin, OOP family
MRPLFAIVALVVGAPAAAFAQTRPSVDARTWRPSSDPEAGLVLEPTTTAGPWRWNASAWASYASSSVVLRDTTTGAVASRPVAHGLDLDLAGGIGVGDRLSFGLDVPIFVWQDGSSSLPETVVSGGAVPKTGLGDLAILGKATVVGNDRQGVHGGFGLAALGAVTLPTGDRASFLGDGTATVSLSLLAEYALGVGAARAMLGYDLRTHRTTWPDAVAPSGAAAGLTFGNAIPWSAGISLRPKAVFPRLDADDRQTWELAIHGSLPGGPVAPFGLGRAGASSLSPVLLAASDRIAIGHYRDASVMVGAEVGLDDAVGVPAVRLVVSIGWAHRSHDSDDDGVPDDVDECPDLPEDRDGIQDSDGCPEDDADGDGVLDTQDACPLVPGVASSDPHKNGCPETK